MQQYSTTGECSLQTFLQELVQSNLERVLVEPEQTGKQMTKGAQALVLLCCENVRALAGRFARGSSRVDAEEFYSIGMLAVCEAAAHGPVFRGEPKAYLYGAAKKAMLNEWRLLGCEATSLDAPLPGGDDSSDSRCLLDILPASFAPASSPVASKRDRALADAMGRLTKRQRVAVRRRAGLPGYGVCSLKEIAQVMHTTERAVHGADYWGRLRLRQDVKLREAVEVWG